MSGLGTGVRLAWVCLAASNDRLAREWKSEIPGMGGPVCCGSACITEAYPVLAFEILKDQEILR